MVNALDMVQAKNQVSAPLKKFDFAFEPTVSALLGGLVFVHETILPIERAEIAL